MTCSQAAGTPNNLTAGKIPGRAVSTETPKQTRRFVSLYIVPRATVVERLTG